MNKLTYFAILTSCALSVPVWATTAQFSAAAPSTRRVVVNSDASAVAAGDLVWAGVFANAGSFTYNPADTIAQTVSNMMSFGWQQFGLNPSDQTPEWSTYTLDVNGSPGQVANSIVDNTGAPGSGQNASFFDNKQVYIVVFNGATTDSATQMGIFTSTSWAFKANNQGLGGDVGTYTTANTNTVTSVGGAGSVSSTNLTLSPVGVPEPSTLVALIGSVGLLGLVRRARRPAN